MVAPTDMPKEYLALAEERVRTKCSPHSQPEDFPYDFKTWVSPYTKGAHKLGGIALVLQDWASAEALQKPRNDDLQQYGRMRALLTNRRLEDLLRRVLGTTLADVYVTNAFPFVKAGGMSASLPPSDVRDAVRKFALREIEIVKPTAVLALSTVAYSALRDCGVPCIALPHPAARIGGIATHETAWRAALSCSGLSLRVAEKA